MTQDEVLTRLQKEFPGLEWEATYRRGSFAFSAYLDSPVYSEQSVSILFDCDTFCPNWRSENADCGSGIYGTIDEAIAQLKCWIRDYANGLLKAIGEQP